MPKKHIPVPSDFARPTPGAYQKKSDDPKKKPFKGDSSARKKFDKDKKPTSGRLEAPFRSKPTDDALGPRPAGGPDRARPKSISDRERPAYVGERGKPSKERLANPYREQPNASEPTAKTDEKMPLNKYIAHCGICSRRDAIDLIKQGKVKVNDRIEKEPGYKVAEKDVILYEDAKVLPQRNLVYYLLNKPKDFITTTDDPEGRKTVMDLFKNVTEARIFPVGRLDRNTTGLLLMTNDGELTQKLSHPKHNTKKVYQVGLDKPLAKADFEAIANGLMLEDGLAEVDEVAFINPKDKKEIGIEIHSGRNRIVRRIFEHLNYEVKTLDRVIYAGLTKKNLPRGKFRELEPQEVIFLKHFK